MNWPKLFSNSGTPVKTAVAPEQPGTRTAPLRTNPDCVYFHVTHWKAGSQWMRGILEELFGEAVVKPQYYVRHVWSQPLKAGGVYPCVYAAKPEFDTLQPEGEKRVFILLRDLRDTLVSAWYSFRNTHEVKIDEMAQMRMMLNRLEVESGLLYLMETWLCKSARIHRTWLESGIHCYRLEDCMRDAPAQLRRILAENWGLNAPAGVIEEAAARHAFSKLSGGREPGQENLESHYRKGVAGDWKNLFTPRLAHRFAELYNDVLLGAGYEETPAWHERVGVPAGSELAST